MRICLIAPEFPPFQTGGIGSYIRTLAEGYGGRGHAVDVVGCDLHPDRPEIRHDWGRSLSIPVDAAVGGAAAAATERGLRWLHRRGVPVVWRAFPYYAVRGLVARALAVRSFVAARHRQYDVVEYPNWPGDGAFVPRRRSCRYVCRLSTSDADINPNGSPLTVALERRSALRAELVIANSHAMNRKGQEYYRYPAVRSIVVPHGIPDRPPVAPPPADGSVHLVSVGRAEERKGTDLLLTALARVLPDFPAAVYRFVGRGLPDYLSRHPAAAAAWGSLQANCPGRAIDCGALSDDDKDRTVGASHWLVAPSRFESFGLMVAEAMRLGTPAVYTTVGGLAEVGAAGPHNLAAAGNDAADLERALRDACTRSTDRAATRAAFDAHFRADRMIDRSLAAYAELVASRRGRPAAAPGAPA
ncbi:MAG: glycosyltransferase family 4 protein [Gemmataceae bacterium]